MTQSTRSSLIHLAVLLAIALVIAALTPALDKPGLLMSSLTHITFYDVAIAMMLAVSLNLILGMTGQFTLGHGGFVAAGAYTAVVVAGKPEFFLPQLGFWHLTVGLSVSWSFTCIAVTAMFAAVCVASILGLLVGLPTLRLRGDYLAIATLGFGEIVATMITNSEYLGRSYGIQLESLRRLWVNSNVGNPPPLLADVQQYMNDNRYMISSFWVLLALVVTVVVVRNIKYSTTGRALLAIREDVIASEAVGVPTVRYKISAFVLGAALAGLGGALLSHYTALNPQGFRFMYSVTIVLFVILGGQGSITGCMIAAAVLTIVPVAIQRNTLLDANVTEKWRMVVYALLVILSMLFMPRGIFGRYEISDIARWVVRRWLRSRKTELTERSEAGHPGILVKLARWSGVVVQTREAKGELPPGVSSMVKEPQGGPGETAPLLKASNVTMRFGGLCAVDRFSLSLMPGEIVGLIGPNGAGKTTVFNVLTGVYRPTSGDIFVGATRINSLKPHRISHLGVARTFQNIRLFANLTVLDNVQIAQHVHHKQGMPAAIFRTPAFFREEAESRQHALGYLDLFGLAPLADELASSLSYGDQRRLEIARALATRPRVLLLDEPAAGMNPTEKRELMEMIQSIRSRFGLTILIIEHDMKVIMGICQRIVVLDYGRTIASGTPAEIRSNPAVIEAYLGAPAKQE